MNSASQVAVVTLSLALFAPTASAQDAGKVRELQRVIDEQQRQLAAQQAQLDAQAQLLHTLQEQMNSLIEGDDVHAAVAQPPQEPAQSAAAAPQAEPSPLAKQDRFDQVSPTGSNVKYSEPAVTVTEPKTKSEISIFGFAELQIISDTNALDNNEFDTFTIPVDGSISQTRYSVNPSRFGFSSTTPLGYGRLNTFMSLDFNGELDEPAVRLREAYGEFIHDERDFAVLAGQTFSTMLDLKSVPETLDFAGPTGYWARRQPLLRFSKLFDHKLLVDVAADTPQNAVYIDAEIRTRMPDFVVAGAWSFDNAYLNHVRLVGLVRDLGATDDLTGRTDTAVGWAVGASGKIKLPFLDEKDNFKFGVQYGDGYGGQLKSGPADALFNPVTGELKTIGVLSTYGGLQHWWTDTIRSNAVFGYLNADNPGFADGERLENTVYLSANLVWNPWKSVTLGVEYLYGRRENVDGNSGIGNRILFHSKYDF